MSWTPREYQAFIRGAQHRQADELENLAIAAMFDRYANNSKRASLKKMFNADQAHRRIDKGADDEWKESHTPRLTPEMYQVLKKGLAKSTTTFKKGG